jgi:hypothetical protein
MDVYVSAARETNRMTPAEVVHDDEIRSTDGRYDTSNCCGLWR